MPESQTPAPPAPTQPAPRKTSSLTVLTAALVAGAVALFGVRFLSNAKGDRPPREPPIAAPAVATAPAPALARAPAALQPPASSLQPSSGCPTAPPLASPPLAPIVRDEDPALPATAAVTRLTRAALPAAPCPAAPAPAPVAAEVVAPRPACPTPAALQPPASSLQPPPACPETAMAAVPAVAAALPAPAALQPPAPSLQPPSPGLNLVDVTQDPAALEAGMLAVGVTVKSVAPRSLAHQAGLQAGDRIVSVGGQPVASVFHFFYLLAQTADGQAARLVVVRGGKPLHAAWPAHAGTAP